MSSPIAFFYALWVWLVEIQRDIQTEIAGVLRTFAETGDWGLLIGFIPWGIAFGAAHALTPGHSKTLLALFVAGGGAPLRPALGTAATLAVTHVSMSVAIVLLGLPIVSVAIGDVGRSMLLETLSRGLLGLVGLWLLVSALRRPTTSAHTHGTVFGITAGLIPCPLTVLVMTYASAKGVPGAGVAFACMMLAGVGLVLAAVAGLAVLGRKGLSWVPYPPIGQIAAVSRLALGLTGCILIAVSAAAVAG